MRIEIDIDKFKNEIDNFKNEKIDGVKKLIQKLIFDTQQDATRMAPNFVSLDTDFKDAGLTGEVGVIGRQTANTDKSDPNNLAAYFEFGTGLSAQQILAPYPQWVKDIAMDYFVTGLGTLVGKPYLFNNFLRHLETFKSGMDKLLEND